ncbi:MAG: hypothetical protein ACOYBS_08535 [Flavobacterium sp.]
MKIAKNIVTISFILLAINVSSAQYGNSGMNGGGMNRMGGQGMNNGYSNNTGKSQEEIEKERLGNLNKSMDKLVKELNLDDLQIIVIRKEIESSSKSIYAVTKAEISNEEKIKEIETINEKTDRTINTFLNTEQKVKYKKIVDERKERMEKYRLSIQN